MENPGILNWRSWSVVRKGQILGASAGAFLTVGITLLELITGPHEPFAPVDFAFMLVVLPIIQIYKMFGLTFFLSTDHGTGSGLALIPWCIMLITNSFLLFLLGTMTGWFVTVCRRSKK